MEKMLITKTPLHESDQINNLKDKSPGELIGMVWQLTLDAWSFKENIDAEPRVQRHIVIFKRGRD